MGKHRSHSLPSCSNRIISAVTPNYKRKQSGEGDGAGGAGQKVVVQQLPMPTLSLAATYSI